MLTKNLLLIFIKNPVPGKVKTRLAATIGNRKAYNVYVELLKHTIGTASEIESKKQVWYSTFRDRDDFIPESDFEKKLQQGGDLGERMRHAFARGFDEGCGNIVIIGSDCPDIAPEHLKKAFDELSAHDLVIGPSADGGYYLLGMNRMRNELFEDISWSTKSVLKQTLKKADGMSLSVFMLPELNDIDTIEDLKKAGMYHAT